MKEQIVSKLRESADIKLRFAKESIDELEDAVNLVQKTVKSGGTIFLFGNGGSAADAQHIAAELVNRCVKDRKALPALAITTDTSVLTSIPNDVSFEEIFSRQLEALGSKGDLAWGITTSGKSPNVLSAFKTAKSIGMSSLAFTGEDKSKLEKTVDCCVSVPSSSTPRVQEIQITLAHIICEMVEESLTGEKKKSKEEKSKNGS